MSEEVLRVDKMVEMAAGIIVGSQSTVGIVKAMEIVGFSAEERRNMTIYQRVRQRSQKLCIVEKKKAATPPPEAVNVTGGDRNATVLSSLTSPSLRNPGEEDDNTSTEGASSSTSMPPATNNDSPPLAVRRNLLESLSTSGKKNMPAARKGKKTRKSSRELQRHHAMIAAGKKTDKLAMKMATKLIKENIDLPRNNPNKKSIAKIVLDVNAKCGSSISDRTAARYVRLGMIGESPMKRGPVGDFNKPTYNALKGAYSTFLKLEQAESKKQSNLKDIEKLVNATVNCGGYSKTGRDLTRKLRKDTADEFSVGKANIMEQR
jgi:hypothetical protein